MKKAEELSSAEKAAALLVAVGPEVAAEIMKHLDENTVFKLSSQMAQVKALSPELRDDLIGEFMIDLKKNRHSSFGGEDTAKKILFDAFGHDKCEEILRRVEMRNASENFRFLDEAAPEIIKDILAKEHPQTIALVLTKISRKKAGEVLKLLDKDTAKDAALRIAKIGSFSSEAFLEISKIIKIRYDKAISKALHDEKPGVNRLAEIMNHVDMNSEKRILSHLETIIPSKVREIRDRIYSFDNILDLTNREIRILIDEISDDLVIAKALKGAGDEIRFKILRNMSNNRATNILTDMERMGAIRLSDINEARHYIVDVMKKLNEEGVIIMRKGDEKLVE